MKSRGQERKHRSESEWRAILKRYEEDGRSQLAFCREAGISPSAFHSWRRRLGHGRSSSAQFIDVTPVSPPPPAPRWALEIEFADGTTARVRG